MFRSVQESRHLPARRRWLYRAEGLAVAGLVCGLVALQLRVLWSRNEKRPKTKSGDAT